MRFARALALRCPQCGARGALVHWLRLREACPACGLPFERAEPDAFLGSMSVNLLLTQLAFVAVLALQVAWSWPGVRWTRVLWVSVGVMAATPFALWPWTKLLWLAGDLAFRPRGEGGERGRDAAAGPR